MITTTTRAWSSNFTTNAIEGVCGRASCSKTVPPARTARRAASHSTSSGSGSSGVSRSVSSRSPSTTVKPTPRSQSSCPSSSPRVTTSAACRDSASLAAAAITCMRLLSTTASSSLSSASLMSVISWVVPPIRAGVPSSSYVTRPRPRTHPVEPSARTTRASKAKCPVSRAPLTASLTTSRSAGRTRSRNAAVLGRQVSGSTPSMAYICRDQVISSVAKSSSQLPTCASACASSSWARLCESSCRSARRTASWVSRWAYAVTVPSSSRSAVSLTMRSTGVPSERQ